MMQTRYPSTLSRQPGGVQEVQISDNNAAQQPIRLSPPMRSTSAPVPQAYNAEFRVPRNTSNPLPVPTMHASAHNREPLLDRAERILSSLPPRSSAHAPATCDTCRRQLDGSPVNRSSTFLSRASFDDSHAGRKTALMEQELPMQTVVTRALRDLEEDFAVHRRYVASRAVHYARVARHELNSTRRTESILTCRKSLKRWILLRQR